jgi:hypothetical protein
VTESTTVEPIVMDAIERYFALLQAHVPAQQMLDNVLTSDFGPGLPMGSAGAARTAWPNSSSHGRCSSTSRTKFCN